MFELNNVVKTYAGRGRTVEALRVAELKIAAGDYVAIVGASGSGKTTLLSVLGGMLSPTSGEVRLEGEPLYHRTPAERARLRRDCIGFVFQTFNLVPYLSALENVQLPLCLSAMPAGRQWQRAIELLEQVGLGDRLGHKPHELSVGQQQRVALARTLANAPRVILADEPTGNLDSKTGTEVLDLIDRLNESGKTILLVTHGEEVAERAHRVLHMKDGLIDREITQRQVAPAVKSGGLMLRLRGTGLAV